ncbi:MAG: hypothetical protein EA388_04050 [Nitriliruptor sp.]|nr:MAG: hypothetical protein EA388_04050 [Nitriliruptor sp.]
MDTGTAILGVPLAQSAGNGAFWSLLVIGLILVGAGAIYDRHRRQKKQADLDRLLDRDPRLDHTVIPCGLRNDELAWWCQGLPAGDRNNGVRYAVEGPMRVDLGPGMPDELNVAAFQWWWEEERRDNNRRNRGIGGFGPRTSSGMSLGGSSSTMGRRRYVEQKTPAAVVKLPVTVDNRVIIRPESLFGRAGITRGGHQFESAEFNRRFRVEAMEQHLALALIDANFQQLMVENFPDQTVEIFGSLLLVAGTPTHRDDSLTGTIGLLPAARQDAHRILRAVPPAYWRAVGALNRGR